MRIEIIALGLGAIAPDARSASLQTASSRRIGSASPHPRQSPEKYENIRREPTAAWV